MERKAAIVRKEESCKHATKKILGGGGGARGGIVSQREIVCKNLNKYINKVNK
jgi:hypothetical protein